MASQTVTTTGNNTSGNNRQQQRQQNAVTFYQVINLSNSIMGACACGADLARLSGCRPVEPGVGVYIASNSIRVVPQQQQQQAQQQGQQQRQQHEQNGRPRQIKTDRQIDRQTARSLSKT